MKSFLIIGLGNFGCLLTEAFSRQSCELMVVDKDEAALSPVLPLGVSARVGDATNAEILRTFDIPSFDACFVSVGSDFQTSLVITNLLKELGAKCVYSKAAEGVQAKFLRMSGADHIIYPEKEVAVNLAVMNLLPVPALDGGRIFFMLVVCALEKLLHRRINPRYEGYIHMAGMALLLALMALLVVNDVLRLVGR